MRIERIVSGGQTGADRGGLDAAIAAGIPHGGWCPKGRKAEDGRIPEKYQLKETKTSDYLTRTEANVVDSDATLVFTYGRPTGGSLRTIEFATKHGKPWLHVDIKAQSRERAVRQIVDWLAGRLRMDYDEPARAMPENVCLNVAGSRESKAPGLQAEVKEVMLAVIRA